MSSCIRNTKRSKVLTIANNQAIIGVARYYGWHTLKPFAESLRQTGYSGDIVLFGDKPYLTKKLRPYGIEYITVQPELPFHKMFEQQKLPSPCDQIPWRAMGAKIQRYALAWLLLQQRKYQQIWLTDTRDVVFLQNPFSCPALQGGLNVFQESEKMRYGTPDNHWHNNSVKRVFGDKSRIFTDQVPLCSGTTYGSRTAMLEYLEVLLANFVYFADTLKNVVSDQAIHNYIIQAKLLKEPCTIFTNTSGPVLTVSDEETRQRALEDNDIYIVHQYDRQPRLILQYCLRFHAWGYIIREVRNYWRQLWQPRVIPFAETP